MMAAVAVGGYFLFAVAVQAVAHAVRCLSVGVGMTFFTTVTFGAVLTVMEEDALRQSRLANPPQRFSGVGRVVGMGGRMQRQQALIVSKQVPMAVQAARGRGQAGSCGVSGGGVAGTAVHGCLVGSGVGGVAEGYGLYGSVGARVVGVQVEQYKRCYSTDNEPPNDGRGDMRRLGEHRMSEWG